MSDDTPLTRRSVVLGLGAVAGTGVAGSAAARLSSDASASLASLQPTNETETTSTDLAVDGTSGWPQFQGSGVKRGVAAGGPSSKDVRWEFGAEDAFGYAQPVVSGDVLYSPYGDGEGTSGVVALTTDGEVVWRQQVGEEIEFTSMPAVADGYVFVGGRTDDTSDCTISDGGMALLLALDVETGEVAYRRTVAGHYCKAPTVADGRVYVVVPKQSQEDGTLVAYDVPTGDELWRYDTGPSGSSGYRAPSVAAADGRVYLAADELEALDAATGEQVWITEATERLKGAERNAPAVVDGTVYVGTGGHGGEFYAVSAADGSVEWTYEADSEVFSAAAVTQDTVYVSLTATDNPPEGVLALDATDGTKRWLNTEVASGKSPIRGAEYVYVGMAALSPDDGSVAWTLEERPGSSVAGDTLYAGGSSLLAVGGD